MSREQEYWECAIEYLVKLSKLERWTGEKLLCLGVKKAILLTADSTTLQGESCMDSGEIRECLPSVKYLD